MKIAIMQASSQKEKNQVLFECIARAVDLKKHEVINFGIYEKEEANYSYIETAVNISLLLESKAVDFVVTGCSSGQGMMLACNSLPDVICGYVENPSDAYLFGRINDGNAVSFPLGLNYGWAGEINLQCTMDKLFEEPFGIGYPKEDALRKQHDTMELKAINSLTKRSMVEVLSKINPDIVRKALARENVQEYIEANGTNVQLMEAMKQYRKK